MGNAVVSQRCLVGRILEVWVSERYHLFAKEAS